MPLILDHPPQLPDAMSEEEFWVGDTKIFRIVGDDEGLLGPFLDNAEWAAVTGATLTLTPPGKTVSKITIPATSTLLSLGHTAWDAPYTFPATIAGKSVLDVWDAAWTVTDGVTTETLGSYRFKLRDKRGN